MDLLVIVFAPAWIAFLLLVFPHVWMTRAAIFVPILTFVYLLTNLSYSEIPRFDLPWIPSLGVSLSFFMDGLGLLFALLISGMGAVVLLYSSAYFESPSDSARFSSYTLIFMMAMLGIVLSNNLLLLFIFWEITSISSYLLIGFYHEEEAARDGARRALLVTGGGGLALLAGFLLMGLSAGTFDVSELLLSGDVLRNSPLYMPMLLLILAGVFSKSAQWPLHFWLPGAMAAPSPASTFLHSATMVKAGIFLLARLSPVLNNTEIWYYVVTIVGLFTFVYGALIALRQTDLKAILAYSTVSWLGALVALQGSGSEYGAVALTIGIVAHALYKGALFLMAGSIDHATGTREIGRLGQLSRKMPWTFTAAVLAVWSMAGIPPFLGFLSKETLKAASLYEGQPIFLTYLFPIMVVIGSALTVTVALRVLWDTFLGASASDTPLPAHEVHPAMWLGPLVLGGLSILLALLLPQAFNPLVNHAVSAIRQQPAEIHLHLFEGINTPLMMSAIAIGLGLLLFALRKYLIGWLQGHSEFNPAVIYEWLFYRALPDGSEWLTSRLQSGQLRYYMMIIFCSFISLTGFLLLAGNLTLINGQVLEALDFKIVFVCLLLMIGAIAGVLAPSRLSAISVLGIEGALLSLLFALFGAPDLAFTQLMIEVITLVLFVLAFHFLPDAFTAQLGRRERLLDAVIAAGAGLTITLLILAARSNQVAESISQWFIDNSVLIGHGHNVVNVILVDFRGLDTQGEIVVLIIAAMGVTALLRLRPHNQPRGKYLADVPDGKAGAEFEGKVEAENQ
jgi:NADH:ubiquinone oxidoreductase subunit 5 (subunit L)/multisubunit Na+/H+ antiporter MnhA subunit